MGTSAAEKIIPGEEYLKDTPAKPGEVEIIEPAWAKKLRSEGSEVATEPEESVADSSSEIPVPNIETLRKELEPVSPDLQPTVEPISDLTDEKKGIIDLNRLRSRARQENVQPSEEGDLNKPEVVAKQTLEQESQQELNLDGVETFDQLYKTLEQNGGAYVGNVPHSAKELIGNIQTIKDSGFRTVILPGVPGLREKVEELLERQAAEKPKTGVLSEQQWQEIDTAVKRLDQEPPVAKPTAEKEKVEKPAAELNLEKVKSFKELFAELNKVKSLKGTEDTFTPQELQDIINQVRNSTLDIIHVTRANGLRDKVSELWEIEKNERNQIIDRLTNDDVNRAVGKGKPIRVNYFNQASGKMEKREIWGINDEDGGVTLMPLGSIDAPAKGRERIDTMDHIKLWNSGRNLDKLFEMVHTAKDFESLEEEILAYCHEHEKIHGSKEDFDAKTLIDVINQVRQGSKDISAVTRSGGLREKVGELLKAEAEPIKKPGLFRRLFRRR